MPIDFHTYFLSSSPPGFDLETYASARFLRQNELHFGLLSTNQAVAGKTIYCRQEETGSALGNVETKTSTGAANAERILSWNQSYGNISAIDDVEFNADGNKSGTSMGKKRVSFADDIGLALENVRVLGDSSDVPPVLEPDVLAQLNLGCSAPLCIAEPQFAVNFPQPLSDYLELRSKVESGKVSLETAHVKGSSVLGTVRVKNIAFEKKVFVRLTFSNWETYDDINAVYSSTAGSYSPFYDIFEFKISLKAVEKEVRRIYFAVCYEAGDEQFWDNNNGENYEIVSLACEASGNREISSDTKVFSLAPVNSWTDFSSWDGISSCDTYW